MKIEERIPLVDEILGRWTNELGPDGRAYSNHVHRVVNFCFALHAGDRDKIIIAACFHDLGIWANHTFDYLQPSMALAKAYLQERNLEHWSTEIELMIDLHHRIRTHPRPLVEAFRKSDLIDVSLGIVKCGLPGAFVRDVKRCFPNAGFHKRLVKLAAGWFPKHPFRPLPVLKW